MKTLFGTTLLAVCSGVAFAADMSSILPNAKPGECYASVMIPAKYETRNSTVVVRQASERVDIVPAQYKWDTQQVLVSEAATRLQVVPAKFRTVIEQIEISPATSKWVSGSMYNSIDANPLMVSGAAQAGVPVSSARSGQCFAEYFEPPQFESVRQRVMVSEAVETIMVVPAKYEWVNEQKIVAEATRELVEIPASYETITERVKVEDAKVVWKKGHGEVERIDQYSGNVMCLVEVPAVYKTIEKRVLKSNSGTQVIEVPAKFETVRVRKLVTPAHTLRKTVPAKYRTISTRSQIADGKHFWELQNNRGASASARKTGNVICKKAVPAIFSTISKLTIETPASVKEVEIPAKYRTQMVRQLVSEAVETKIHIPAETREVTRRVKVTDSRMEWRTVLCDTNTTPDTISRLQQALTDAGYHLGQIDGTLSTPTMNAVNQFQRANGMAIGGLTIELLNKLGVNPG